MEHKLIFGGQQYLPFARSRLKALRATGQAYATQRFILPDAQVKVQISGEHDYIYITGGGAALAMDSGVVDVGSFADSVTATFLPGTLYETDYVAAYNTGFILPPAGPPRLKTGATGQMSGIVTFDGKTFAGQVPIDVQPALSFKPAVVNGETNPRDTALQAKKKAAILCPASMFTGRCRMYVQALYGAHSNGSGFDLSSDARPALMLDNKTAGLAQVLLSTGCGVYLDPATGKHWLFTFTSGAKFYPLRADAGGESLRKYLITIGPPSDITPLNDEDREHLEAYILSQCLPAGIGTAMTGSASNPYSMGYSWHFNWDGLVADAVVNEQYQQDAVNAGMKSTWYRITITQPAAGQFNVEEAVVEGPSFWSVYRAHWAIAEPEWSTYTLVKTTPRMSQVGAGSATFYAFYLRDELKTCSVSVAQHAGNSASVTYTNGAHGGPNNDNCWTRGNRSGARIEAALGGPYLGAIFNCAGESTPALPFGQIINYPDTIEVGNKQFISWIPGVGSQPYAAYTLPQSDDNGDNQQTIVYVGYMVDGSQSRYTTFDTSRSSKREERYGRGTVVVPFYDAEAVYLESAFVNTVTVLTNTTYHLEDALGGLVGKFIAQNVMSLTGSVPYDNISYTEFQGAFIADGHQLVSSESIIPAPTTSTTTSSEKLVCRAGTVPATFQNLGMFHDNAQDNVSSGFYTMTSSKVQPNAVALAPNYIAPTGAPSVTAPALVGWI